MSLRTRLATVLLGCWGMMLGTGCITNEITDELSTEIRLETLGAPGMVYEVRKRFTFSRPPRQARAIYLERAILTLLAPQGADLSMLHRIEILLLDPATEEAVLFAVGEDFKPGDRHVSFAIVDDTDLMPFITEDARVTLVFRLESSSWSRPLPESGIEVLARTTVNLVL